MNPELTRPNPESFIRASQRRLAEPALMGFAIPEVATKKPLLGEPHIALQAKLLFDGSMPGPGVALVQKLQEVKNKINANVPIETKTITSGSMHKRSEYWNGSDSEYKDMSFAQQKLNWLDTTNKLLLKFKDKPEEQMLRKLGISVNNGAGKLYDEYFAKDGKGKGDLGYFAFQVGTKLTAEELIEAQKPAVKINEKDKQTGKIKVSEISLLEAFGRFYHADYSEVAKHLAEGVSNIKFNTEEFATKAEQQFNQSIVMEESGDPKISYTHTKAWEDRLKERQEARKTEGFKIDSSPYLSKSLDISKNQRSKNKSLRNRFRTGVLFSTLALAACPASPPDKPVESKVPDNIITNPQTTNLVPNSYLQPELQRELVNKEFIELKKLGNFEVRLDGKNTAWGDEAKSESGSVNSNAVLKQISRDWRNVEYLDNGTPEVADGNEKGLQVEITDTGATLIMKPKANESWKGTGAIRYSNIGKWLKDRGVFAFGLKEKPRERIVVWAPNGKLNLDRNNWAPIEVNVGGNNILMPNAVVTYTVLGNLDNNQKKSKKDLREAINISAGIIDPKRNGRKERIVILATATSKVERLPSFKVPTMVKYPEIEAIK